MRVRFVLLAAACGLSASISFAADRGTSRPADYDRTVEQEDRDHGAADPAAFVCEFGVRVARVPAPGTSCAIATQNALAAAQFDDAFRYASIGCEKYHEAPNCRLAARVPLISGNAAVAVPVGYSAVIKRLAQHVCFSGTPSRHAYSVNPTGGECTSLARHFLLARDPEYRYALAPAAKAYFVAAYDAPLAIKLLAASCKRWRDREACEQLRAAS